MPDNPVVPSLVAHAAKVTEAQAKLRDAMAKVAAELAAQPAPPPKAVKPA